MKLIKKIKYPLFRARPHMISQIMGGIENKPITDVQLKKIETLENKKTPRTEVQEIQLTELRAKRDAPRFNKSAELSEGALTVANKFMKEFLYQRNTPRIRTSVLDKGIECEEESIEFANKIYGTAYEKNEKTFQNKWLNGTPDVITADEVKDIKSHFTFMSFPLWEKKTKPVYVWQLLGYYDLTKKRKGGVISTLVSTPLHIIEKEYWKIESQSPVVEEISDEGDKLERIYTKHFLEFAKDYQYEDVRNELKIKYFPVEYDKEMIEMIHNRVDKINEYIQNYE